MNCNKCPLRMFNNKCYNLQPTGNPLYGNAIVVPNVDYNAYKNKGMSFSKYVEVIKDIISSTGELDDYYVIPLIRCRLAKECPVNSEILTNCSAYFAREIVRYKLRHVMLLGDAAKFWLNIDNIGSYTDSVICDSKTRTIYNVSYSPFVKYIDDNKFEDFKSHLIKWYNSIKTGIYNYGIINI